VPPAIASQRCRNCAEGERHLGKNIAKLERRWSQLPRRIFAKRHLVRRCGINAPSTGFSVRSVVSAFLFLPITLFAQRASEVDSMLGADDGGNVFIGPTLPFGMAKPRPEKAMPLREMAANWTLRIVAARFRIGASWMVPVSSSGIEPYSTVAFWTPNMPRHEAMLRTGPGTGRGSRVQALMSEGVSDRVRHFSGLPALRLDEF
jgi:hypothetical protein